MWWSDIKLTDLLKPMELFLLPDTLPTEVVFIGWTTRDKPITCIATEAYGVFTINDQESKCYTTATYACSRCTSQDVYQLYFINKDPARRGDIKANTELFYTWSMTFQWMIMPISFSSHQFQDIKLISWLEIRSTEIGRADVIVIF